MQCRQLLAAVCGLFPTSPAFRAHAGSCVDSEAFAPTVFCLPRACRPLTDNVSGRISVCCPHAHTSSGISPGAFRNGAPCPPHAQTESDAAVRRRCGWRALTHRQKTGTTPVGSARPLPHRMQAVDAPSEPCSTRISLPSRACRQLRCSGCTRDRAATVPRAHAGSLLPHAQAMRERPVSPACRSRPEASHLTDSPPRPPRSFLEVPTVATAGDSAGDSAPEPLPGRRRPTRSLADPLPETPPGNPPQRRPTNIHRRIQLSRHGLSRRCARPRRCRFRRCSGVAGSGVSRGGRAVQKHLPAQRSRPWTRKASRSSWPMGVSI